MFDIRITVEKFYQMVGSNFISLIKVMHIFNPLYVSHWNPCLHKS